MIISLTKMSSRLKELRGDKALEEVAEAIGVTTTSLSKYEEGVRVPNDQVKVKIAEYFGVTVDSIFVK